MGHHEFMQRRPIDTIDVKAEQLVPGTLVVCKSRMPSIRQPWIHEIYIGAIEEPGHDLQWNGKTSEEAYCTTQNRMRVRYPFGVEYDSVDSLVPVTSDLAALPFREKIAFFLGPQALRYYDSPIKTLKEERETMGRDEVIRAKIADIEGLIQRRSIDATELCRDRIFTLVTTGPGRLFITWEQLNTWFDLHRPEIPGGRGQ